jgi:hypothetical protein
MRFFLLNHLPRAPDNHIGIFTQIPEDICISRCTGSKFIAVVNDTSWTPFLT